MKTPFRECVSAFAAALTLMLAASPAAQANDGLLLRAVRAELPPASQASRLARQSPTSDRVQAQYDTARALAERLRAAEPVSPGCRPLLTAARRFAAAQIKQAEGADKLLPAITARGTREADAANKALSGALAACRPAPAEAEAQTSELASPRSGEAFFGAISMLAPVGATSASVILDGHLVAEEPVRGRRFSFRLRGAPGRVRIEVQFQAGSKLLERVASHGVWLLPRVSAKASKRAFTDTTWSSQVAAAARDFRGYSAAYVADLGSGRTAGYNTEARFPAASMVKLGLLVAALDRYAPNPEDSPVGYDLGTLAAWSSNLATNRLLLLLGRGSTARGAAIAQATLARLGATQSTFPGPYLVGTAYLPGAASDLVAQPPLVSQRVTTARDLAGILASLHAAATGDRGALARSGLTVHTARIAVALLLASRGEGDNIGLFRETAGLALPLAQKHGWISAARHSAALIYTETGLRLAVVLTYRPALTRREASAFGARIYRLANAR